MTGGGAVLADVHISDVYPVTMPDMRESLADMNDAAPDPDGLVIIGDLTEFGQSQDYPLFDLTLNTSPHPDLRYLAIGNHEYHASEPVDTMRQRFLNYVGRDSVYYVTSQAGIPFIFLGSEGIPPGETSSGTVTALLSDTQMDWFETTLASVASNDRPTLVFLHQPPEITTQQARLTQILSSAPNVVFCYGHLHEDLNWFAAGSEPSLLGNQDGYWRVQAGCRRFGRLSRVPGQGGRAGYAARMLPISPYMPVPSWRRRGWPFHDCGSLMADIATNDPQS